MEFIENQDFDSSKFALKPLREDRPQWLSRDAVDRRIQTLEELVEMEARRGGVWQDGDQGVHDECLAAAWRAVNIDTGVFGGRLRAQSAFKKVDQFTLDRISFDMLQLERFTDPTSVLIPVGNA
ncbi:hypothetical protein RN04_06525 [Arthrobacter sp. W1]|nr:hypothetical protein RN04_06525 [Arthrobacter sp. W1]